jgi:hypothetical protein
MEISAINALSFNSMEKKMPSIDVTPSAMDYLKSMAEPFVDTPATVLDRIIEQHRRLSSTSPTKLVSPSPSKIEYGIESLPPLLHSKVEVATINGKLVSRAKWSILVQEMVRIAASKGAVAAQIAASMNANTVLKNRSDTGFVFVPEAGLSFQKMDANRSCKAVLGISRQFSIPVSIDFFWRDDPNAHNPGANGRIVGP